MGRALPEFEKWVNSSKLSIDGDVAVMIPYEAVNERNLFHLWDSSVINTK